MTPDKIHEMIQSFSPWERVHVCTVVAAAIDDVIDSLRVAAGDDVSEEVEQIVSAVECYVDNYYDWLENP